MKVAEQWILTGTGFRSGARFLFCVVLVSIGACQGRGEPPSGASSSAATDGLERQTRAILEPEAVAVEEVAAAVTVPGSSRANPLPPGQPLKLTGWDIQILETVRGDDAWQVIHLVNSLNKPAGDGREYLLVRYHVSNVREDATSRQLSLHVTGDRLVTHFSFDAGVVVPEPRLETYLGAGEFSEGWQAYRIFQGERNLMAIGEDLSDSEDEVQFVALEPSASISISPDSLQSIRPTELGTVLSDPVPFGQIATGEDWQLSVRDVVGGEAAWQMALAANQFNEAPAPGMRYIAAQVWIRNISLRDAAENISSWHFSLVGADGTIYERPVLVEPEPELFADLFPGGEAEGWLMLQARESEQSPTLLFDPDREEDSVTNRRYLSLVPSGR